MLKAKTMFDTLAYANKLKRAGLDPMLAEIQAEAQLELLRELTDNHFATKQDINELRQDINELRSATKQNIEELRSATNQDINKLRSATKQDIDELRSATKQDINDLKRDIDELRFATKQDIKNLENNIIALQDKLVIKMGSLMAIGIGILATLITVLHVY